jgi:septal ring factor EnvC (AmiA/AmiB activator)
MKFTGFTFWKNSTRKRQAIMVHVVAICLLTPPLILLQKSSSVAAPAAPKPSLTGTLDESSHKQLPKKLQQEIIEKNVRIRKLQEGIIEHKIKILDSKEQERTLLGDLEKIEKELQLLVKMLADLRAESEKQELLLADSQEHLRQVLTEKRAHQVHVKNRLAAYYRLGSVGLMNVLFSAESLPELLDFNEYFGIMVQQDQTIIKQYLGQIREANQAREKLALEKLRLMKLAEEVRTKEDQLNQIQQEKNILLQQVNTEQHLYEQAVQEIEEAAADLAATLHRLETAITQPPAEQTSNPATSAEKKNASTEIPLVQEGFPAQKGLLDPPVRGPVITLFGQQVKGKFESTMTSQGIDIKVRNGEEIRAVYDGKIIHSGYLRGYGNLMIIDHGQQYFSLVSRAADFYKKEGTTVAKGEAIGMTGDGDPLFGEGLHFEIRKGANPEDPLLWLRKDAFPNEPLPPVPQVKKQ